MKPFKRDTLILTVGLPCSGKTTWAKQQQGHGIQIVNPDAIRLAIHGQPFIPDAEPLVWTHAQYQIASAFHYGISTVILDACAHKRANREKWLKIFPDKQILFKHFYEFPQVCKQRAIVSNKQYLIPVIEKMSTEFEFLEGHERNILLSNFI